MLQLHLVQIDTLRYTKVVTVLATSPEAACKAASVQAVTVIGAAYVGLMEGLVVQDAPRLLADSLDSDGGDL